ncbi:protein kinase domain-containing protein, partial [Streptomyces phytophilus]|uniref:protein kinase domain-containing protein n=1 Tax=Streptomyces phytophilus TaxID=722715 RepID=UPI0015F0C114
IPAGLLRSFVRSAVSATDAGHSRGSVPGAGRYCEDCGERVGRRGLSAGYCPACGHAYSLAPRLAAGDVVGERYEVVGPLARGGRGWVYLARDVRLGNRPVVLKGDAGASMHGGYGLSHERGVLAGLDHPDIVRILDFAPRTAGGGESEKYLVIEYVPGPTLSELIRDARAGRLPLLPEQAVACTLQILGVLDHLHGEGLVHGDMKPSNVMLSGGRVKVIDFGAVRRTDDESRSFVATYAYMAPEVGTGDGYSVPGVQSDVYAVGRTLQELAKACDVPEEGAGAAESLHLLVRRATAPDPVDRFRSCAEMAGQLEGVLRQLLGEVDDVPRPWPSRSFHRLTGSAVTEPPPSPYACALALPAPLPDPAAPDRPDPSSSRSAELRPWAGAWHAGKAALTANDVDAAYRHFTHVRTLLPGEAAPQLALSR